MERAAEVPSVETKQRVKAMLRRELKLGDEALVTDDTPLIGGDLDLDSLDVLLLVTGVEKEFRIKIPNEAVGEKAFSTVTTLALFVEDHVG